MATATTSRPTRAVPAPASVATPGIRRRRSLPRMIFGALAVVLGAVVFGVVGLRADPGVDVLAVARPVTAGAQIVDADLRVVHIAADPALHVFPASQRSAVVGQIAAVSLAPGSLLTAEQLGAVADPPPGQSVIAVGVKTGRAPAGLAPGASVLVLVVAQGGGVETGSPPLQAPAVVRAVEPTDSSGVTVVTLQLSAESAVRIASATGEVALVLRNPGR
jgi:SAF domain